MYAYLCTKFKLFTVILSTFALLNLQIGVVYAEVQSIDEIAGRRAQQSQAQQSTASQNRTQEQARTTKEVDLTKTDIANSEIIYFLTMIGMTLFIMSLWRYQPMSTDMRIAMGAAIVMMGAEVISFFNTKKKINAGTYKLEVQEDGTVNNMQLDALREQRESYVALKKYASLKAKMAMAGTAAFTVATGYAYYEGMKLRKLQTACGTAIKELDAFSISTPPPASIPVPACNLGCTKAFYDLGLNYETPKSTETKGVAQKAILTEFTSTLNTCVTNFNTQAAAAAASTSGINSATLATQKGLVAKMQTTCSTYLKSMYFYNDKREALPFDPSNITSIENHNFDMKLLSSQFAHTKDNSTFMKKILNGIGDFFFPQANASLAALGLGGVVLSLVLSISMKGYAWMDQFVLNPTHRAYIYGIVAAGLGLVIMMTKKAEGQAQDNIDKIDELIARFERLQNMKVANLKTTHQNIGLAGQLLPQDFEGTLLADTGKKFPCPPVVGRLGTCESVEQGIKNSNDIGSLGSVMGNIAALSGRVADGIAGQETLSAGTIADINQLAAQSAIAQNALRQMEKQINDQEKAEGREPTNFAKQQEGILARLTAATNDALRDVRMSPQAAVAALGGVMPTEDEKKNIAEQLKLETSSVASKGGANMNNVKAPVFDFSFGDDGFSEAVVSDDFSYSDDMYAKAFESNSNSSGGTSQIVGNRDVSLFQVISVRYMKSGLPRLLQEIE